MDHLTAELLRQGLLGAIVCALALVVVHLWKSLQAEHAARLAEARETTKQLLAVTEKTHEALTKLHDLAEHFRPRD